MGVGGLMKKKKSVLPQQENKQQFDFHGLINKVHNSVTMFIMVLCSSRSISLVCQQVEITLHDIDEEFIEAG